MGKFKEFLSLFKKIWSPQRDAFLVRSLLAAAVGVFALLIGSSYWVFKLSHPTATVAHHGAEETGHAEHGEEAEAHGEGHGEEHASEEGGHGEGGHGEGGHGGATPTIFKNPIPKEIRARRDGLMEPDHDLVDPDITTTRGLASIMKEDLKVSKQYRFVDFPEIMAGTSPSEAISGKVITKISLELDSYEGEAEVRARSVEFQGLISSLISERKRDVLKTVPGRAALKADILREINHQLKKGRVIDVLLPDFFVM